jgi:hypothetical protein
MQQFHPTVLAHLATAGLSGPMEIRRQAGLQILKLDA